ncbi:methylenetetrahydrofolate--tRNA-(uracil-5-)-methyltransferase [Thermotomaculum hydrothermale]|uniref:Methylenetetrahydrofolate--tRNA-(uracil-5-)-methyltransferase TrmFO n=1 Tax=Thermotomaculum hydrothermale TaxID=981385 RepID=A0A7R6PQH4_9BACT|nr:methylenetetrahydrofolate--tRNA-(uracil(54)-C(5))-methyltransferase (FADH(2)-oxidizing) TrmFO [Thermotomaculum hydrothermale]BBB33471.1 methylenetetrahydrofolate--tRNA-(uracil-5-)-methyltransferase [Thermotomaculum hydrothermale]
MVVHIIGAGLAGSEAAYFLANRGIKVKLYDIKPEKFTEGHKSPNFGELLCSNSLRGDSLTNAVGLLKAEMRLLNSLVMRCAEKTKIPAGGALAVDRHKFEQCITESLNSKKNIEVICKEVENPDELEGIKIIAAGPLATKPLTEWIMKKTGSQNLFFFDAIAPIVDGETIDYTKAFFASRYGKGEGGDYLNCPMKKEEYLKFWKELINAETVKLRDFEKDKKLFEGCLPVEEIAKRGEDALRFGPLKPVGLKHPETNEEFYAVVQLRREDSNGRFYNIVGFQTHLTYPEQKRVFSLIPGLENARFERFGRMHRNTYINSPEILDRFFRMKKDKTIFFAGQISGVEGYVESAASGLMVGFFVWNILQGKEPIPFPEETALNGLSQHISTFSHNFQPTNITYSLIPDLKVKIRNKKERRLKIAERSLESLKVFAMNFDF